MRRIQHALVIGTAILVGSSSLAEEVRYFHDDLDRLVRVEYPDGIAVTYTYDAVGNRLSRTACSDVDLDTFCNQADNCPGVSNPGQADGDGDLAGDACDCRPADGTVFDAPHEIVNLRFPDGTSLEWDSDASNSGSGTGYRVMRGLLDELPVGSGASESCLEPASTDTASQDASEPAPGAGFFYLVRGFNDCGEGSYGVDTSQSERLTSVCP